MTSKRSRGAFEADLQALQSPYAFYGTPLPPLDPGTRDDGSYVPVWKQEVTDERGRKRLHGAFTGGFSAGYFNTVGSKEGWTPSTFVSSRQNRAKDAKQQKIEDFMDEEDIREAEDSKQLQTAEHFAGLGGGQNQVTARRGIVDLLKPEGETMGVKLLKRMGWREGQGIGPKVRRSANLDDGTNLQDATHQPETHLFAPSDTPMTTFVRKVGHFGLGFEKEERLGSDLRLTDVPGRKDEDEDQANDSFFGKRLTSQKPRQGNQAPRRGAFGVGVLNDTGSDDEDPYSVGPRISYNRTIGGDKKKKKKPRGTEEAKPMVGSSANPLLGNKPVFISKKTSLSGFRKCHDGRLPLDGFVLADAVSGLSLSSGRKFSPPDIPPGWKSAKLQTAQRDASTYMSTADAAKATSLDPKARAELLGEEQLPGKSIFDWMTPEARERLVKATGRTDLPPALGEKAPKGFQTSDAERRRNLWDLVPKLDKEAAVQALKRAVGGWMPYSEDESKRARYRTFLEVSAGLKQSLPDRLPGSTTDEWVNELREFTRAAEVFKPISGVMASRFTSASSAPKVASDQATSSTTTESLLTRPPPKPEDPAEEAAKIGMFGPLTRDTIPFYPTRLLCKRFNIKPPAHVQMDPGDHPTRGDGGTTRTMRSVGSSLVSQEIMDQVLLESSPAMPEKQIHPAVPERKPVVIEPERNEALEGERPGEAVFKAIFGSDSEGEEED